MKTPFLLLIITFYFPCWGIDLASETVYLTWQRSPSTTMTIQWISNSKKTNFWIEYRAKEEKEWQQTKGTQFPLSRNNQYILNRVELIELQPDTTYLFRIAPLEPFYSFRTMPQNLQRPIRFVVGGDMYHDTDKTKSMRKTCIEAAKTDPDFALIGGDIAYAVPSMHATEKLERWIDWIRAWSHCMVTQEGRLIPVVAAIGNHDIVGQYDQTPAKAKVFSTLFPMPGNRIYNVLDFETYLSLFILDSGHANPVGGLQTKWLNSNLQERSETLHKLAIYHVPAYPSVRPFDNSRSTEIRRQWVPLFENGGIQMAFEHHDHAYKRTFPMWQNKPNSQKGVLYIGDGAWSVDEPRPSNLKGRPYLAKFLAERHFILVLLDKDSQSLTCISPYGKILDEYQNHIKNATKLEEPRI